MKTLINNRLINFYKKNGYMVVQVFNDKEINYFEKLIKEKINLKITNKKWKLENYHKEISEKDHNKVIKNTTRYIAAGNKTKKKIENNKIISIILKNLWGHSKFFLPNLSYMNGVIKVVKNKNSKNNQVSFRVVVPKKVHFSNSAPPHIDLNAGKIQNRQIDGKVPSVLTLWTPIIGFSKKYTLRFAPGSHVHDHPIGKKKIFITPVFKKKYYQKFKFKRLDLKKGQAILFDINLLHGGADNLGIKTRASLEFRLYNYKKINFKKNECIISRW